MTNSLTKLKHYLVKIVIFGLYCEILSELRDLVKIVKFGKYCKNLANIVKFCESGENCEILSTL